MALPAPVVDAPPARFAAAPPPAPMRGERARRVRRAAIAASLVALIAPAISYIHAITQPSNSTFGIRSVEWLRDNGAAGLVSQIENSYYSLNAPAKGGPALRALPRVGVAGAVSTSPVSTSPGAHARKLPHFYLPPRIQPIIAPALPGEGVWRGTRTRPALDPPLLVTIFRPEPAYPREVVGLAWINTHRTVVTLYPGRLEPSVRLPRGTAEVPPGLRRNLVATFNSGFKLSDSHGGFALNGHTYAPMKPGVATLVRYRSGQMDVTSWTAGPAVGPNVVFARQNLPLLIDGGRPNPNLGDGPAWGTTVGNAIRVWRSAIGVDGRGNLIYAAGNNQTVGGLAAALAHAGAVRAMELDINSFWVTFNTYARADAAGPSSLLPSMVRPSTRYLSPDDRDFFAVFKL